MAGVVKRVIFIDIQLRPVSTEKDFPQAGQFLPVNQGKLVVVKLNWRSVREDGIVFHIPAESEVEKMETDQRGRKGDRGGRVPISGWLDTGSSKQPDGFGGEVCWACQLIETSQECGHIPAQQDVIPGVEAIGQSQGRQGAGYSGKRQGRFLGYPGVGRFVRVWSFGLGLEGDEIREGFNQDS